MPPLPTNPALLQQYERLLSLQIDAAEEQAELARERKRQREAEKKSREINARSAKQGMEALQRVQTNCQHMKEGGKTALGAFHHLADPVTQKEKMSVTCVRCMMVDEGTPQEMYAKYGDKMPTRQVIGRASVDVDY